MAVKCKIIKNFIDHPLPRQPLILHKRSLFKHPFYYYKQIHKILTVNLGPNQLRSFRWEYPKLCKQMLLFLSKDFDLFIEAFDARISIGISRWTMIDLPTVKSRAYPLLGQIFVASFRC